MASSAEDRQNYQEYYYQISNHLSITNVTKADAFKASDIYCVVKNASWLKPNSGSIHEVILYDKNQNVGLKDGIFQLTFEARSPRGSFVAIITNQVNAEKDYISYPIHIDSFLTAVKEFKRITMQNSHSNKKHKAEQVIKRTEEDIIEEIQKLRAENKELKNTIAAIKKMASQTARNLRKQTKV
ncbi:MAG TPA: hypothetical protein VGD31_17745 [Sphingobacteriaceae bacterium]